MLEELEKTLGISDEKTLTELVVAYEKFEDSSLRLFPGVTDLLKLLIRNKIKMGVVTNGDAFRQWKKLLVLGIADLFDFVAISTAVGIAKPDPQIFQLALDSLAGDPTRSVFVGDRPDLDTKGAKQSGMYTIRVLQGRASNMQPSNRMETADAELTSVDNVGRHLFGP